MKNLVSEAEPALARANLVSQERERYWTLKYLQDKIGQSFSALVLEKRLRGYSILLCDYLLEVNLVATEGLEIAPGETITVTLQKVDLFTSTLKVLFRG